MLHLAVVEFNVNLSPLAPPPPFIYLFYGFFSLSFLSPWETKCQWRAGTAVALRGTCGGGSPETERFRSLCRLKLSATSRWPARILRGNCAFDWLNGRQFPSLHYRSFVATAAQLSSSPTSVSQPSALTDTPSTTGEFHLSELLSACRSFLVHAMYVRLVCTNAQLSQQLSSPGICWIWCLCAVRKIWALPGW